MNNLNRQWIGILVGVILFMISFYLLEPLKTRYFFGILILCIAIFFIGTGAYHLRFAEDVDELVRISKQGGKKNGRA